MKHLYDGDITEESYKQIENPYGDLTEDMLREHIKNVTLFVGNPLTVGVYDPRALFRKLFNVGFSKSEIRERMTKVGSLYIFAETKD